MEGEDDTAAVAQLLREISDLAARASASFTPDPAKVATFAAALTASRARAQAAVARAARAPGD